MLTTKSKHYLRIGHTALNGILYPKVKFSSVAALATLEMRLPLHILKQGQLLPTSAGLFNPRYYCRIKLTDSTAASDSTSTSNGLDIWSTNATTDPTSASSDLNGWSPEGLEYKHNEALENINVVKSSQAIEEPMREGFIFWLTDITITDLTCLLPLISAATRYLIMKIGMDRQNTNTMKFVSSVLPIVVLSFMMNSPATIPTYLACRLIIYLGNKVILKIPAVRQYVKMNTVKLNEQNKTKLCQQKIKDLRRM